MKKLFITILSFSLLSSCAIHYGSISSSSLYKSVKYEDIAFGVSQTKMYFGIGGLSQDALVLEGKRELIKNRPLRPDEEYVNFTVDFKKTFFPFYSQTKVTMSADVVRFQNETLSDPYSEEYKNKLFGKNLSNILFSIGDSIIIKKAKEATIISFKDNDNVRVLYKTKSDKNRTKTVSLKDIYTISKPYKGYKIGDRFIYSLKPSGNEQQTSGKIIGLGLNSLIIRDNSNTIQKLNYNK